MRKHRTLVGLLALAAINGLVAIACGSGSGPSALIDPPGDRAPDSRDNPGNSTDKAPLSGRDVPPSSVDQPSPGAAGPSGGSGAPGAGGATQVCPPCDQKFDCQITVGNTSAKASVTLATSDGQCFDGNKSDAIVLDCSGKVLQAGVAIGTWGSTNGNLTASVVADGQMTSLTCTPHAPSATPTTTATGAPAPTTTAIADSGTKG